MLSYMIAAKRSTRIRGEWGGVDCTVVIRPGSVTMYDMGEKLPMLGEIIYVRPGELSFHREWLEYTPGLVQLKKEFPDAYAWLTSRVPLRPDQVKIMESA